LNKTPSFYIASLIRFVCTFETGTLWAGAYALDHLYDRITELKSQGLGYRKTSQRLNDEGVKTPRGKHWLPQSVFSIIRKRQIRDARLNETPEYTFSDWRLEFIEKASF